MRTSDSDGELVKKTLAGDLSAFDELVNRYRDAVFAVAYHYLGNFADAEDAAQEAFVHAYLHLNQLRAPDKFAAWLRRIVVNICADVLRRQADTIVLSDVVEGVAQIDNVHDDEVFERLERQMFVRDLLNRLSEKTRLVVTLFYINGYTHDEIADFLEIPVNTVRSRLRLAKQQLREEMMKMVTDVLNESKPDPEFTKRVVEEAMRRAEEAEERYAHDDALRYYDEALTALENLGLSAEQRRLKMELLWKKGQASEFPRGKEEALKLYEQALEIAEELGDRKSQARILESIGLAYVSLSQRERGEGCCQRALKIYEELGDTRGQGQCLFWLGSQYLFAKEVAQGKRCLEQAIPLFEAAGSHEWSSICHAIFDLLDEVGEEKFPTLLKWSGTCTVLEKGKDVVKLQCEPGIGQTTYSSDMPKAPFIGDVFWQVSHLRKFLDTSVPVGSSWSGNAFSYSYQPLRATVTVKNASERVAVPAGTFENCLLTEQVTIESDLPDDAPEYKRQLNREIFCGTRRAWYAPGVGLVQLQVQTADGTEVLIQLKEFSVQGKSDDYLPLSIGNEWTYSCANIPSEFVIKEFYRVTANEGDLWYLEHYTYLYKEGFRPLLEL